ncbi:class I SAM-dependent methyltransferase [Prolixibacteraceae bacterium Z1-6]|uniref:Class I SAM-dependent methyltransferase n=1 Tax=Draconibacterium aestuarii TaxID=2998507 RepID=A0A9X3F9Y4_9BACT|nr:class I SAM-dependent methyltransferase [Prolixibacteraceae bacterium Z1-6]
MNVFTNPEIADDYDDYYQTEAGKEVNHIEVQLIEAALQKVPAGKMLELGCGTGHWTEFFVEKGFDVVATDISDAMLQHAISKGLEAEIVKADSGNLLFDKESFDVVASVTMLEFVDDRDKVIDEIYRVLKPGGWLLLGCLNANSQLAQNADNDPVFKNAAFLTPEGLTALLSRVGTAELTSGVHFSPAFQVTDGTAEQNNNEPAFLVALVQKIV